MTNKVFKDDLFRVGSTMVRLNSIEHLRVQNCCRHLSRSETVRQLAELVDEPHGAARAAVERLETLGKCNDDVKTLVALIYHGQMYGLGASPQVPVLGNLLWHAAAFILEDNGVTHPNEILVKPQ